MVAVLPLLAQNRTALKLQAFYYYTWASQGTNGGPSVGWAGLFAHQWFKLITFAALASLFYHAWVGVRDIWMDYVKPVALRLVLQIATILWLVGCAGWAAQILWRV